MSGFDFEDAGDFGSERDAENWAKKQGIRLTDIRTRHRGDTVRLEVRRAAVDGKDLDNPDHSFGRRTGW